jgi:hypothetical protein
MLKKVLVFLAVTLFLILGMLLLVVAYSEGPS